MFIKLTEVAHQKLDSVAVRNQQGMTTHAVDPADMLLTLKDEFGLALLGVDLPGARRIER